MKRFLAMLLSLGLAVIPTQAIETVTISSHDTEHEFDVTLDAAAGLFSVTVPTQLPVYVDVKGEYFYAGDAAIVNNSGGVVLVSDVEVVPEDEWTILNESDEFVYDTKQVKFSLNNIYASPNGDIAFEQTIKSGERIDLDYSIKVPQQSAKLVSAIANVEFIVEWYGDITGYTNIASGSELYNGATMVSMDSTYTFDMQATYGLERAIWTSSNPIIATVSDTGVVTPVRPGNVTITYKRGEYTEEFPMEVWGIQVPASEEYLDIGTSNDVTIPQHHRVDDTWYTFTSLDTRFQSNNSITSISLPDSITEIPSMAFSGCTSLSTVSLGDYTKIIGEGAFRVCSALTSIYIPRSVTSIGNNAFHSCNKLTSISIPNTVTFIGTNAFWLVPKVIYSGTATGSPWGAKERAYH